MHRDVTGKCLWDLMLPWRGNRICHGWLVAVGFQLQASAWQSTHVAGEKMHSRATLLNASAHATTGTSCPRDYRQPYWAGLLQAATWLWIAASSGEIVKGAELPFQLTRRTGMTHPAATSHTCRHHE
jgi:hypothetical protein